VARNFKAVRYGFAVIVLETAAGNGSVIGYGLAAMAS
jgi:hypothetical protein